jgi:hypothetical protein
VEHLPPVSGTDFLLAKPVASRELQDALSRALGVPREDIDVSHSIEATSSEAPITVEMFETAGEYRTHIALYFRRSQRESLGIAELREVARILDTDAIMPDESADPYAMLLVHPDGAVHDVGLDPESLDVRQEYRLE